MNAIIQARSTSTRLPNKGLLEIDGLPIIDHVFQRVHSVIKKVVVAVPFNDPLKDWCYEHNVACYEGPEDDVLTRFYKCATSHQMDYIVRITADCPLLDTASLAYMSNLVERKGIDFITNLPCQDGNDIEIMSYRLLKWMNFAATDKADREHVTKFAKENAKEMNALTYISAVYRSPYLLEWLPKTSIDTQEDLERVQAIYAKLKEQNAVN